jgi:hypothetical protein
MIAAVEGPIQGFQVDLKRARPRLFKSVEDNGKSESFGTIRKASSDS